jgi:dUTPase
MNVCELNIYNKTISIFPHQRIKIPTGVHFNIPKNNMLLVL